MNYRTRLMGPLCMEGEGEGRNSSIGKSLLGSKTPIIGYRRSRSKENESQLINCKPILVKKDCLKVAEGQRSKSILNQTRETSILKQYEGNQVKIQKMTYKLNELYTHYRSQKEVLTQMKESIPERIALKAENQSIREQISRIKEMLKEVLLNREKTRVSSRQLR